MNIQIKELHLQIPEELKSVMIAYAAGKPIQLKHPHEIEWTDHVFDIHGLPSWFSFDWRIKPSPKLIKIAQRVTSDPDWINLECTFSDGQKFTAIQVDKDCQELANLVQSLLENQIES